MNSDGLTRRKFIYGVTGVSLGSALLPGFCSSGNENPDPDDQNVRRFEPAYLALHRSGELYRRGTSLWKRMEACDLCPRRCGVNRLAGQAGFCRASSDLIVSSFGPHHGEEPPLTGRNGSGTVFFANCALRCVFCINFDVSHGGLGKKRTVQDLAGMMLFLQNRGCHNINVVTPTHYSPHILLALDLAAKEGLRLPLVYNTCAWEKPDVLQQLDGIVDIYLPDFKYADEEMAVRHLGGAARFPQTVQRALLEMHRQVGVAREDNDGLVRRGLMIRHLVMPNDAANTREVLNWIADNLPKDTYVNIMSQYTPVHRASEFPEIDRRITRKEYARALQWAQEAGLTRIESQRIPLF